MKRGRGRPRRQGSARPSPVSNTMIANRPTRPSRRTTLPAQSQALTDLASQQPHTANQVQNPPTQRDPPGMPVPGPAPTGQSPSATAPSEDRILELIQQELRSTLLATPVSLPPLSGTLPLPGMHSFLRMCMCMCGYA